MKRFPGIVIAGLVLALVVALGTSSRAEVSIYQTVPGSHVVESDDGFATTTSFDVRVYNSTGSPLDFGIAVVLDTGSLTCPAGEICVKPAPAAETEKVIGVTSVGCSDASPTYMAVAGLVRVRVTGTAAEGDLLRVSSTTAGKAESAAVGGPGVFAVALESGMDAPLLATFIKQEVF